MSSTAAEGRSARGARLGSPTPTTKTTKRSTAPIANIAHANSITDMTDAGVIQALKDELEELTESKLRLDDKVTQLEERAQYLEASARLSASKQATEIMDLKEKARKLEIDLCRSQHSVVK